MALPAAENFVTNFGIALELIESFRRRKDRLDRCSLFSSFPLDAEVTRDAKPETLS